MDNEEGGDEEQRPGERRSELRAHSSAKERRLRPGDRHDEPTPFSTRGRTAWEGEEGDEDGGGDSDEGVEEEEEGETSFCGVL